MSSNPLSVQISDQGPYPLAKFDVFLNGSYVGSNSAGGTIFTFVPDSTGNVKPSNELRVVAYDSVYNSNDAVSTFLVNQ